MDQTITGSTGALPDIQRKGEKVSHGSKIQSRFLLVSEASLCWEVDGNICIASCMAYDLSICVSICVSMRVCIHWYIHSYKI